MYTWKIGTSVAICLSLFGCHKEPADPQDLGEPDPADMAVVERDLAQPSDLGPDLFQPPDLGPQKNALCGSSEFCWQHPLPQGNWLSAVYVHSSNAAWLVGESGTVLFYDGRTFTLQKTGTDRDLTAVWASGTDDVWAAGFNLLLHYDGRTWSPVSVAGYEPLGGIRALWGFGRTDVYVGGGNNTLLRYDGKTWTKGTLGLRVESLWGTGPNDLWTAETLGWIGHYDGTSWKLTNTGIGGCCKGIWGSGKDDVYFGAEGKLVHYDGSKFTALPGLGLNTNALWGSGKSDIWAVGGSGAIFHYDGMRWQQAPSSTTDFLYGVSGVGGAGGLVLAVGQGGRILRHDGMRWAPLDEGQHIEMVALWAVGPREVFAGGYSGLLRFDGSRFVTVPGSSGSIHGVYGTAANDVWAVGSGIYHWDGAALTKAPVNVTDPFHGVWALSKDDAWVVGRAGQVYRFNGTTWTRLPSGVSTSFNRVWGSGKNDVWISGDYGVALHWDGTSLSKTMVGDGATTGRDIFGLRKDRVYMATSSGLFHFNGVRWEKMAGSPSMNANAVGGTAEDDLWLAGDSGVFHFDGTRWDKSLVHSNRFYAVWSVDRTRTFVGSVRGVLLRAP